MYMCHVGRARKLQISKIPRLDGNCYDIEKTQVESDDVEKSKTSGMYKISHPQANAVANMDSLISDSTLNLETNV